MKIFACASLVGLSLTAAIWAGPPEMDAVLKSEFIYEIAPTPACHASTIVETKTGLVAAWFGGPYEKHPEVGIWLARHEAGQWGKPTEVANGVQPDGRRHPTWNPVLFQPTGGPLMLFYKAGPNPEKWWGMLMTSKDGGKTWSVASAAARWHSGPHQKQTAATRPQRQPAVPDRVRKRADGGSISSALTIWAKRGAASVR